MAIANPVDVQGNPLRPGLIVAFVQDKKTGAVLSTGRVDSMTDSGIRVLYPLDGEFALQNSSIVRTPMTKMVIIG